MSEKIGNVSRVKELFHKLMQLTKLKLKGQPVEKKSSLTPSTNPIRRKVIAAALRHESRSTIEESRVAESRSLFERNVRVKVSKIISYPLYRIVRNIINWFTVPLITGPIAFAALGFFYKTCVLPLNSTLILFVFWLFVASVLVFVLFCNACCEKFSLTGDSNGITEDDFSEMLKQLPWSLCVPEVESANWVNQILFKFWYLVNDSLQQFLKSKLDQNGFFTGFDSEWLSSSNELIGIRPVTVSLGQRSPEITGIHVLKRGVKRNHVIIDLEITYKSDIDIFLSAYFNINIIVEQIYIRIFLRIVIGPLIREAPTVATFSLTFFKQPVIIWRFSGILRCLNSHLLQSFVEEFLYGLLGNPNKFEAIIAVYVPNKDVKLQVPYGVFRVDVIEAIRLPRVAYLGKPNAYCEVRYENETRRTQVVFNSFHPEWQRSFIFLYTGTQKSFIEFYIYDDDIPADDLIGCFRVAVDLFRTTGKDYNGRMLVTPLRDIETPRLLNSGKTQLCFRISYFELSSDINTLRKSANLARKNLPLAVLTILVDYATGLETVAHQVKSPELRSLVRVSVGNQAQVTSIQERTGYPVWEESLSFFLFDPHLEDVHIEVVDMYYVTERRYLSAVNTTMKDTRDWVDLSRSGTVVGYVTLPVANVVNAFEMKTANVYQLEGLVEDGHIRVLTSMKFTVDSKTVIDNHARSRMVFLDEDRAIDEVEKNNLKKKR